MLYLVGLGLRPEHLTEEARSVLASCEKIYLDVYTNLFPEQWIAEWERRVGRAFVRAERRVLEDDMKRIIREAREGDVAIAVHGDPLVATTHWALALEAMKEGVDVQYVPGMSIHTVAQSLSGLQHYKFGRVVTVPYLWKESPSFYKRIAENRRAGLHTLLLMDLHPDPMTIPDALRAILYWERELRMRVLSLSDLVVGIARACWDDCYRFVGTVEELMDISWPDPPHTLVIPGELHPVEEEVLYVLRRYGRSRCQEG